MSIDWRKHLKESDNHLSDAYFYDHVDLIYSYKGKWEKVPFTVMARSTDMHSKGKI